MSCVVGKVKERLENELCYDYNYEILLILQPFRHFTYVTTHSPTLPSLYLRNNSFSNPSFASPTSQFILQPFFRFSYVTSSSLNSPGRAELILQPFCHFIYVAVHYPTLPLLHLVTTHSSTLPSLYLRHSSFSNPSVTSATSQFILQPFFRFFYVTSSSLNSPGRAELILQPFRHFTYVTTHSATLSSLYLRLR